MPTIVQTCVHTRLAAWHLRHLILRTLIVELHTCLSCRPQCYTASRRICITLRNSAQFDQQLTAGKAEATFWDKMRTKRGKSVFHISYIS